MSSIQEHPDYQNVIDTAARLADRSYKIALQAVLALPELEEEKPSNLLAHALGGRGYVGAIKARNQLRSDLRTQIEQLIKGKE